MKEEVRETEGPTRNIAKHGQKLKQMHAMHLTGKPRLQLPRLYHLSCARRERLQGTFALRRKEVHDRCPLKKVRGHPQYLRNRILEHHTSKAYELSMRDPGVLPQKNVNQEET